MRGTHPSICVATLACVVWELLEGAHHGTCVASLCECSLQQQLITGVRVGPAGSAVELEHELEAAEQSWYGVAPGCEVHSGCTTCDLCVISLVVYITPRSQRAEPSHSLARCLKFQRCLKSARAAAIGRPLCRDRDARVGCGVGWLESGRPAAAVTRLSDERTRTRTFYLDTADSRIEGLAPKVNPGGAGWRAVYWNVNNKDHSDRSCT
jgi:hypothetical protein